jgi:hypothetical protein
VAVWFLIGGSIGGSIRGNMGGSIGGSMVSYRWQYGFL